MWLKERSMKILDLSSLKPKRFVIIGEAYGQYQSVINLLFQQMVNFEDIVIFTGNIVHENHQQSIDLMNLIKDTTNIYSVFGQNEFTLCTQFKERGGDFLPLWFRLTQKVPMYIEFLLSLPHMIKINDNLYVVNCGLEPYKPIAQQDPDVTYTIGEYDPNSKFYKFDNPEKKSWYDFKFESGNMIIFSGTRTSAVEVPAGISLYRSIDEPIKCAIINVEHNIINYTFGV